MLNFRIETFHLNVLPMRTRFPFRYGIASLTWLPHVLVTVDMVVDGRFQRGLAAEGLPPKWFTKDPDTSFAADLAEMVAVIQNAARIGQSAACTERDYGGWWREVQDEQMRWAGIRGQPGLLAGLGVSLMERAVLDGMCRAAGRPLHEMLRSGMVVEDLGMVRAELSGVGPLAWLPKEPLAEVRVRHTVGLADWLTRGEVPEAERLADGLPWSLEECVEVYGLTHFKIKLSGVMERDRERLRRIGEILERKVGDACRFTLDGNEAFPEMEGFRAYFEALGADAVVRRGLRGLLFVEQPLRREVALEAGVGEVLRAWSGAPDILMDEADGELGSLPQALRLGYAGVSHKNCKGILKGLANAATIARANAEDGGTRYVSGEDLANVAPVALMQDLAMQALLGVNHVERNGHHYFRGLSMWGAEIQDAALAAHGDLLRRHQMGFVTLNVKQGVISTKSVNAASFGCGLEPDWALGLESLSGWIRDGGLSD
jgi:hypothetical protein